MEASIDELPALQLQAIAVQAARTVQPLAAMRLLQALAVRCARDADARAVVCTALNVQNDFYSVYSLLFRCIDAHDLVALFACVQRAYGTRVDIAQQCVRVDNAYLRCAFHINGKQILCSGDVVMLCDECPGALLSLVQRPLLSYNSSIPDMVGARKELKEVSSPPPAPALHLRTAN
jgi:hypothetical protein